MFEYLLFKKTTLINLTRKDVLFDFIREIKDYEIQLKLQNIVNKLIVE